MDILKLKKIYILLLVLPLLLFACKEEIDNHFKPDPEIVSGVNLMELIDQKPELTTFAYLLRKTGYDKVLTYNQSFTVWAPLNESLEGVDLDDNEFVLNLVTNHIARFTHSASGTVNKMIYMINTKNIRFQKKGDAYFMGDIGLVDVNLVAANGILHTISESLSFKPNLWQILLQPEFDLIRTYLYSFNKRVFSPEISIPIDVNEEGLTVYDSVFYNSNIMFPTYNRFGIGALDNEDSTYTMILPTNQAWMEAYERIKTYFVSDDPLRADSIQHANTNYAIVKDLVFRGIQQNPDQIGENDSLVSTRNSPFYNPGYLFSNALKESVSNGLIYKTDLLKYKPWESWHQPLKVEAEYTVGRENSLSQIATRYALDRQDISNFLYLDLLPLSSASRPSVSFEIPNTLSAAYNIYCVFVHLKVLDPKEVNYKTRAKFDIQRSVIKDNKKTWVALGSNGATGATIIPANNTTDDSADITKMLVYENFVFTTANYNELDNKIRIKVTCSITQAEQKLDFSNEMLIDYIILEPVRQ